MKVAVVILNWNGSALLAQFLPSVVKNTPETTIYVADNASTDNSVAYVRENFPQVKILQNKVNGGFARGYNDALQNLQEDIFVLLNNDVEVPENWLPPLVAEFARNAAVAAVQPKIKDFRKKDFFEYAGAAGGFIDSLGYPYCRGRIFDTLEQDLGQYDETVEIFWATGACMAIKKTAFFEAGGFDEDFFAHQEEIDLCWRLFNMGKKMKAVGTSQVYHLGGGTLNNMHPRKTFYNFRNSLFALLKNAPKKGIFAKIFLRLILDGAAGIRLLLLLQPSHTFAIVKAHFSFYFHFRKMWKKRDNSLKIKNYHQQPSIVWSYFARKITKFENL